MINRIRLAIILCLLMSLTAVGQIKLPKLINDGMVLQRNTNIRIWGWASAKENVTVKFLGYKFHTIATEQGEWEVQLSGLKAGGPYSMEIEGENKIVIKDILVGDVWICSGQSNMALTMERASSIYKTEIANSGNSFIRSFEVPRNYNFNIPQKDVSEGKWISATPENVLTFSAVSYFFGLELYNKYHVPIGLINASLGGSPIEAWISEDALKLFPEYYDEAQQFKNRQYVRDVQESDRNKAKEWYSILRQNDKGYVNPNYPWYLSRTNISDWSKMQIPGYWADEEIGKVNGVVWFRKDINIPYSLLGKNTQLILGRIVGCDSVFVNGTFVGSTPNQYPLRVYNIPGDVLQKGHNTIVVRVISNIGKGGFVIGNPYELVSDQVAINLSGEWYYRLGTRMDPLPRPTMVSWKPTGLFNAMIAPLIKYSIKGTIWYQGEGNVSRAKEYSALFAALINDWRRHWGQGDFPFLYVQLSGFGKVKEQPSTSNWALLREAQLKTLLLNNTGMAVTIDIGEWNNIHPLNKKDVGKRLALAAQNKAYQDNEVVYSGPSYQSMEVKGDKVILSFNTLASNLDVKGGGELNQFSIAGKDKRFVWANAKIENGKVVIWSDQVCDPVAVRYAWGANPEDANLINEEGLLASPFRTDSW